MCSNQQDKWLTCRIGQQTNSNCLFIHRGTFFTTRSGGDICERMSMMTNTNVGVSRVIMYICSCCCCLLLIPSLILIHAQPSYVITLLCNVDNRQEVRNSNYAMYVVCVCRQYIGAHLCNSDGLFLN